MSLLVKKNFCYIEKNYKELISLLRPDTEVFIYGREEAYCFVFLTPKENYSLVDTIPFSLRGWRFFSSRTLKDIFNKLKKEAEGVRLWTWTKCPKMCRILKSRFRIASEEEVSTLSNLYSLDSKNKIIFLGE